MPATRPPLFYGVPKSCNFLKKELFESGRLELCFLDFSNLNGVSFEVVTSILMLGKLLQRF